MSQTFTYKGLLTLMELSFALGLGPMVALYSLWAAYSGDIEWVLAVVGAVVVISLFVPYGMWLLKLVLNESIELDEVDVRHIVRGEVITSLRRAESKVHHMGGAVPKFMISSPAGSIDFNAKLHNWEKLRRLINS